MCWQVTYHGKGRCANNNCGLNTGLNPADAIEDLKKKYVVMSRIIRDIVARLDEEDEMPPNAEDLPLYIN